MTECSCLQSLKQQNYFLCMPSHYKDVRTQYELGTFVSRKVVSWEVLNGDDLNRAST